MKNSDRGLLDCCYTETVMGDKWRDKFFTSLFENHQAEVKILKPRNCLKFGGENPVSFIEKLFSCYLFGKKTTIAALFKFSVTTPLRLLE